MKGDAARMNRLKTFFLMVLLTAVFLLLGGLIAGEEGLIVAFILAIATNFSRTGIATEWPSA